MRLTVTKSIDLIIASKLAILLTWVMPASHVAAMPLRHWTLIRLSSLWVIRFLDRDRAINRFELGKRLALSDHVLSVEGRIGSTLVQEVIKFAQEFASRFVTISLGGSNFWITTELLLHFAVSFTSGRFLRHPDVFLLPLLDKVFLGSVSSINFECVL